MGSVVIFFYALWSHREKVMMIERGVYQPVPFDVDAFSLLAGVLLTAVGLVLSVVFLAVAKPGLVLLGGLIPLSMGIGFLAFYTVRVRRYGR
jgi:hypothetical protein